MNLKNKTAGFLFCKVPGKHKTDKVIMKKRKVVNMHWNK